MLVASIVILFTALALGLLVLLERYETAHDKARVAARPITPDKVTFYDPFPSRQPARTNPQDMRVTG